MSIAPRPELSNLEDYVPGKSIDEICEKYGLKSAVKLASNENPWGPSPKAKEAYLSIVETLHLYPRGNAPKLIDALAAKYKVKVENLILGNGSDEVIDLIGKAFLRPGDVCVGVVPTFSVYEFTTLEAGAEFRRFDVGTGKADIKKLAAAVDEKTRVLFLCSPNNPTGVYYTEAEILELLSLIPKTTLLFLDEAYAEFAVAEDYPKLATRLDEFPNLFLNRTFSKIYGLAGLRLGYGMGNAEMIKNMWKVKPPFDVNLAAQAGAVAALSDTEFVESTRKHNREGIEVLTKGMSELGFEVLPTQGNFVCIKIGEKFQELLGFLESCGMIVRGLKSFGLPGYIRVTAGKPEENAFFLDLVKEWVKG